MKITLASYHTVTLRHGGPKTQIQQTRNYLEQAGVEVKLMDTWEERKAVLDCDLFHLFASNFGTYDLARYLKAHDLPFVVSPIFFTRRSPRAVRLVSTADRLVRHLIPGIWSDYGITRDICHWAEHCLPNTSAEQHLMVSGLGIPVDAVTVVPNGVEDRYLNGNPDLFYQKYGIKEFVLHVGHIGVERKNTLFLIRALGKLDVPAVIIGRIYPSKEAAACLEEAGRNRNLLIIEGLDHDSPMLSAAYAACDVFVLPARYETPGIAALEAGLAGAKVVITPYGGTKDYFGNMATYVNPYSVDSIRKGIESALSRDTDDRLKRHIQENFLWQRVAQNTVQVYESVLGTGVQIS
ncbi:MAG: glycosyltransferase family 4 protein [Candidatus Neomarinimicrobiota bacterium]